MKKSFLFLLVMLFACISVSAVTPEDDGYVYTYRGDMNGGRRL